MIRLNGLSPIFEVFDSQTYFLLSIRLRIRFPSSSNLRKIKNKANIQY